MDRVEAGLRSPKTLTAQLGKKARATKVRSEGLLLGMVGRAT